jgi:DUF1365 family protein
MPDVAWEGWTVTASAIYEGTVRHRRFAVRPHRFRYRLALTYIDLDELPELLGGRLLGRGPGIVRFRRRDYLGDPAVPLADSVRDVVAEHTGVRPAGPIRVLTNLSTLGHCFNPVSFYYCMDDRDGGTQAVVAEVTNTPWGERHAYVLLRDTAVNDAIPLEASRPSAGAPTATTMHGGVLAGSFAKSLHVSPYMGMDHRYVWRVTEPRQTLSVHIESRRDGRLAFDATLSLRRRELTNASLTGLSARYPVNTVRTLALIYAQAALLKLKGVPIHPHPQADLS